MASIYDNGVASLADGWETGSIGNLRHLRTVLSFRAMLHLRKGGTRAEKEALNCFELVRLVRARISAREKEIPELVKNP